MIKLSMGFKVQILIVLCFKRVKEMIKKYQEGFQELSDELLQEFKSNGACALFLFLFCVVFFLSISFYLFTSDST